MRTERSGFIAIPLAYGPVGSGPLPGRQAQGRGERGSPGAGLAHGKNQGLRMLTLEFSLPSATSCPCAFSLTGLGGFSIVK